jgi:hypothetical protein
MPRPSASWLMIQRPRTGLEVGDGRGFLKDVFAIAIIARGFVQQLAVAHPWMFAPSRLSLGLRTRFGQRVPGFRFGEGGV